MTKKLAGRPVIENNMAVTHPKLAREFDRSSNNGLRPQHLLATTSKRLAWKCSKRNCQHLWMARGSSRAAGSGCPACSNKVATARNNMAVTHPKMAREFDRTRNDGRPQDYLAGTSKRLWWKCAKRTCQHVWQAAGYDRKEGHGCPACANKVATERNNMAVTHPEVAASFNFAKNGSFTPEHLLAGTTRKLWWTCLKGHEWQASGADRIGGHGCPVCANQVVTHENCMAATNPRMAAELHPTKNRKWNAHNLVAGTTRKLWWQCTVVACGHQWQSTGSHRVAGLGCPACSNKVVTVNNNMKATHPDLAREFHPTKNGKTARWFIAGTTKRLWWRCANKTCRHEWQAAGADRVRGTGCPRCSDRRFKNDIPANVYVLCGQQFGKVGVSNVKSWPKRLARHRTAGVYGDPVRLVEFATGREALIVENALKNFIHGKGWAQPASTIDGHSEAFPAEKLDELLSMLDLFSVTPQG
jgi:hypothetical protein